MKTGNNPYVKSLEERLLGLVTAACAPLSSDSLVNDVADMSAEDFTVNVAVDEIKFLKSLADAGLSTIANAFECLPSDMLTDEPNSICNESPAVAVALLSTATFANRLAFVSTQLHQICMNAVDRLDTDPSALVKSLESRAKEGERPAGGIGEVLKSCLDFTPNSHWEPLELPLKNHVGFKETAAVICEDRVEEEALKVPDVRRKNQRKPTGFHKFTFKALMAEDLDNENGDRRHRSKSEDEGSTRAGSAHGSVNLSNAAALSEAEDEEALGEAYRSRSSSSSVVFNSSSNERQVIEDEEADPEWELQQRHQQRYARIRKRIPTGHPSMMKGPQTHQSGEFVRNYSSKHVEANTEANKNIQLTTEEEEALDAAKSGTGTFGVKKTVTMSED